MVAMLCSCQKEQDKTEKDSNLIPSGSSSATGQIMASDVTYDKSEAPKRTFDNTYYKLTQEKKLCVAYIGGSVTVGTGSTGTECWRAYTTNWFKENYPLAEITEINAAIGGTGAVWGLTRLERDVISKNPDLVFVEFSVNDSNEGLSGAQSASLMESIVRTINTRLPYADIVIVSVPDSGSLKTGTPNKAAHKAVALHNGIEYADMGAVLIAEIEKTGNGWDYYVTDSVHPNAKGYRVYADNLTGILKERLADSAGRTPALTKHKLPDNIYISCTPANVKTIFAEEMEYNSEQWSLRGEMKRRIHSGRTLKGEKGAEMTFEFEGTTFAITGEFWQGSNVEFTVDGGEKRILGAEEKIGAFLVYDNLTRGPHKVTFKCTGDTMCRIAAVMFG